jgi:hypothetical protein
MRILLALALACVTCGGDDAPMLKGEFCDRMGDLVCSRAAACQLETYNACFQGFKGACCGNSGTCQAEAPGAEQIVAKCTSAMPNHSCNELRTGVLPAACLMN